MRLLFFISIFAPVVAFGQSGKAVNAGLDTTQIVFRDTVFNFAFDSIYHNLGDIPPVNENNYLVKYFKYVGKEPITISRAWTEDPHYICRYPNEALVPGKIYSFTVCFWHKGKQGNMSKVMGFYLPDGNRIMLRFRGAYIPSPWYAK
jgi:hypothetical protein